MKKLITFSHKELAESQLKHFRRVAITNRFAKGKKYDMIQNTRVNSLGFKITDYTIIELSN